MNHEGGRTDEDEPLGKKKSFFNYRLMFCGGMTRKDAVPNYSAMTSVIGEQDQECAVCSDFNQGERASIFGLNRISADECNSNTNSLIS